MVTADISEIQRVFALQQSNYPGIRQTNAGERISKLRKFQRLILDRRPSLEKALYADLRKSVHESALSEIYMVTTEIKHACKHLKKWMKPERVPNPITFLRARGEIRYESRGVVLILAPWNYPFQLAVAPLVSAIAAGNCVIVKPSEVSSHTSRFIKDLVAESFPEDEVAVFEGDHSIASSLLEMPFHHIFFTGSTAVGRIVMEAAARHHASVTLELGGKSPVLIDEAYDIKDAASKIMWGKLLNAGQSCVAPDYVLVPASRHTDFIDAARESVRRLYGSPLDSPDFGKIISVKHHERIKQLVNSAVEKGARVELGNEYNDEKDYVSPTILSNIPEDAEIMQEEIFGPVLPVVQYESLDQAIAFVNAGKRPLSLYIFSDNHNWIETVLCRTFSGGVCINDVAVQFANVELPFGGINHSGMGSGHGQYGFKSFSHARAVLHQPKRGAMSFFYPPFTGRMKKLLDWTIKYL